MSNEVILAIVSASSALFGSLIGVLSTILSQQLKYKHETNKEARKNKIDLYLSFIGHLQSFVNKKDYSFISLTNDVNEIKLMGSKMVSEVISQYYFDICSGSKLDKEAHNNYQTRIINAMRKDLGLKSSSEEKFGLFGYNIEE